MRWPRCKPRPVVAGDVVWLGFSRSLAKGLMLFNSYPFIFLFLPVALAGYFAFGRLGNLAPVIWLALASLAFYSVSNWQFVALLLGSIAFNYAIGWLLIARPIAPRPRFAVLTLGVAGDLAGARLFQICRLSRRQSQCAVFDRPRGQRPAAGRHLLLHLHPDRVPGRRLQGQCRALCAAALCAVRHLLSASDRGTDPAPQGHDPAIRARGSQAARSASDPVRPDHLRASACSRRPALPTASSRWSRSPSAQ